MNADVDLAKQWLAKAKNDLLNADNNLRSEIIPYDTVCFYCQQAAEKLLYDGLTVIRCDGYGMTVAAERRVFSWYRWESEV